VTNETILTILEHLCNEARNSAHATFGALELLRDVAMDSVPQATITVGRTSADQLLRSIDDVRELVSNAPPSPASREEFDLALCVGEIVEVLSLASGKRAKHMLIDAPPDPVLVAHDRGAVEQMLTRILNTAFKLAKTSEVRVKIRSHGEDGVRLTISARDGDLAHRLAMWLNVNPDEVLLQDAADAPFGIAVMVAGKRLRRLAGSASPEHDAAGHCTVNIDFPAQAPAARSEEGAPSHPVTRPNALNILVAEDCDDSFALSQLLLHDENVWRARDGSEALRMIQKQRFDVVLMDVHMEGTDGYAAIRNIRDWETQTGNARTLMVVMSSDDLETQKRSAAECGCSGFLRKPVGHNDLTSLLFRLKEARTLVE